MPCPNPRAKLAFGLICDFFGGDVDKANYWFNTYNPRLGLAPVSLMKQGNIEKLLKWVRIQLDNNIIELRRDLHEGKSCESKAELVKRNQHSK